MTIKHRWQRIIIGIIIGILVLLLLLTIGGYFFLKPLVTDRVSKGVLKASDGLYQLSFSDIQYNPGMGEIVIKNANLRPDTNVYKRLHAIKKAPDNLMLIEVPTIKLTGVNLLQVVFQRILDINTINVHAPTIQVLYKGLKYNLPPDSTEQKTPYQLISKFVKSLHIKRVTLTNVDFTYENRQNAKPKKSTVKNLDVEITNILVDSASDRPSKKVLYADDYTFNIKAAELPTKNHFNTHAFKNIVFSLKNRYLSIEEYHLKPRASKMAYAKMSGGRNHTEVILNNIVIEDIRPEMLFPDTKLYAGSVRINKGLVQIFKNKAHPVLERDKTGEYPHQLLKKLDLPLNIDTVFINNTKVDYSEYDPEVKLTGFISFNRINGKITNVTNDSLPLAKDPVMRAQFHSYFMNRGSLDVAFTFNIPSKKGDFTCQGQLGNFEGTSINNITVALTKVSVQSLKINKYVFRLKADDYRVTGTGTLHYENLKATILKVNKDTVEKKPRFRLFKKRALPTFVVNNLVLKDANPRKNNQLKTGTINYKRPRTKSFFGAIWGGLSQSLFQSVTGTVKD
ncbi:hypothetical protein [Emticicia sp. 21SJ11W-3]|uniref:hypothetical protein n=1 Tax=Emticicia sp. 21SJ11W-3 TaxID=2916755 RepID=UPI00209F7063|nr:hypothetical protein [Emticicia sp. 21SJ11W-3]UTA67731.1 hypothetical protein MB380_19345 [Emticicia sp. 21SJ11W-3]